MASFNFTLFSSSNLSVWVQLACGSTEVRTNWGITSWASTPGKFRCCQSLLHELHFRKCLLQILFDSYFLPFSGRFIRSHELPWCWHFSCTIFFLDTTRDLFVTHSPKWKNQVWNNWQKQLHIQLLVHAQVMQIPLCARQTTYYFHSPPSTAISPNVLWCNVEWTTAALTPNIFSVRKCSGKPSLCVCVCVREREREREPSKGMHWFWERVICISEDSLICWTEFKYQLFCRFWMVCQPNVILRLWCFLTNFDFDLCWLLVRLLSCSERRFWLTVMEVKLVATWWNVHVFHKRKGTGVKTSVHMGLLILWRKNEHSFSTASLDGVLLRQPFSWLPRTSNL